MLDAIFGATGCPDGVQCMCPFEPERLTIADLVSIPELPSSMPGLVNVSIFNVIFVNLKAYHHHQVHNNANNYDKNTYFEIYFGH